jgi:nicotinamidase-related amidase
METFKEVYSAFGGTVLERYCHLALLDLNSIDDGFSGETLEGELKDLLIDILFVCGLATDICVAATVRYNLIFPLIINDGLF